MVDNNENNPLNDAVEQVDTGDENVGQQQGQQNQQSTIATTIATGAESADAADEINEALNANPSAAGGNDQESEQSAPQGEGTESADAETQPESSNVIEGEAANAQGQGTEAPESNPVGAGAQSVGGDAQQSGSAGGQSAQGQTDPLSQSNSAAPSASTQAEPSTQTASEQFEVNVLDQQSIAQSQQDDSFDSETTQSTFEVQIDNVNDAAVVNGMEYTILEDGLLSFTAEDLLASASDIDGDSLSIAHVSYGGTDGVLTNLGGGTYTFAPNENFNGNLSLNYGVSDGTVVTDGIIDVAVTAVNDIPVTSGPLSYTIDEDGSITLSQEQLLINASDVDGDDLTASIEFADNASITVNENGIYTLTPDGNFSGDINFNMSISDGQSVVSSNIELTVDAIADAPNLTLGSSVFALDTFETGMEGWSGAGTADSSGFDSGQMLGQQNNQSGDEEVSKTYDVPAGASEVTIEFDFYRLDSWDDHNFNIYIDGELFSVETFSYHGNDSANVIDVNGQVVGQFVSSENAQIHGTQWPVNPHYSTDQSHHF
ncbi:tandem-95 repeat protein, partial [Vibrio nomapromontoriensis]|uniref:cadherin-like domain-containing protein n=1 Tax=Vibrio nomapromontoriensis TaxID=2910246 RepID=UPI003D151039